MRTLPAVAGIALLVTFSLASSPALAQGSPSRWGVSATATPSWNYAQFILSIGEKIGGSPIGDFDVHGSEFTLGFVRGSDNGGDWGVSLVSRTISDDSIFREHIGGGSTPPSSVGGGQSMSQIVLLDEYHTFSSASLTGIEVHKYSPYLRTRWVQVGLTTAIGFAKISGTSTHIFENSDGSSLVLENTAAHAFNSPLLMESKNSTPIGRVELTVGVRATDNFKVKVGGGLSFPGISVFRVGAGYLF